MEVMGLMLGQFVDDYTVNCIDVFAMPQSGTGVSVEAVDPVFQTKMLDMLKQTGRPEVWSTEYGQEHRDCVSFFFFFRLHFVRVVFLMVDRDGRMKTTLRTSYQSADRLSSLDFTAQQHVQPCRWLMLCFGC